MEVLAINPHTTNDVARTSMQSLTLNKSGTHHCKLPRGTTHHIGTPPYGHRHRALQRLKVSAVQRLFLRQTSAPPTPVQPQLQAVNCRHWLGAKMLQFGACAAARVMIANIIAIMPSRGLADEALILVGWS